MKSLFEMYAAYNAWVNERLYDAAARVAAAEYRRDRGAFFGSLHGTLNHLLLGDRIWMHRFTGTGAEPRELDGILYEDFGALRVERSKEDARISQYIAGPSERDLAGTIRYRSTRSPAEIAGEAPSFDLLVYQRQTGASLVKGGGGDFSAPERRPR